MKKKLYLFVVTFIIGAAVFAGCGKNEEQNERKAEQTVKSEKEEQTLTSKEPPDESGKPVIEEETQKKTATVYYVDEQTGEVTSEQAEAESEQEIWALLQEKGILTEECQLLSFTVNETDKTIDLDFNAAVGERIRSMGTTGETQIIGCIVNTYLESYGCSGIKLTEEGRPLETSHGADFDGYTGTLSFE